MFLMVCSLGKRCISSLSLSSRLQ
uniref:Uncharacterized protein n=1 Tax=Arundo donax TaxID=35708 RepID=A0A0A8Y020_ARUDO